MNRKNITMIDELPSLEDVENNNEYDENLNNEQYQKYIRGTHRLKPDSGMTEKKYIPQHNIQQNSIQEDNINEYQNSQNFDPLRAIHCIDIIEHVKLCPICSRFYKDDKTIYIIIIIMLVLLCLILIKKILNV
jgi:arginyl-tRNA--protein-N-Asp/Glu arginylyltransferase